MTMTSASERYSPSFFGTMQTFGLSSAAEFVDEQIANGRKQLRKSNSFGSSIAGAIEELRGVEDKCKSTGWDGYGAAPVEQETVEQAERFLNAFPLGVDAPSVDAEPDGQIAFEWYQSQYRMLSVSVSPDGDLHYAALLGYSRRYGTEPFFGEVPAEILRLVQRVTAE